MDENVITVNVANTVTICAMAFLGFAALNAATSFFRKKNAPSQGTVGAMN